MSEELITIKIPASLFKRIEKALAGTDKNTVEEYIISLLEEKVPAEPAREESLSDEDEEKIKERLKALGYMD